MFSSKFQINILSNISLSLIIIIHIYSIISHVIETKIMLFEKLKILNIK